MTCSEAVWSREQGEEVLAPEACSPVRRRSVLRAWGGPKLPAAGEHRGLCVCVCVCVCGVSVNNVCECCAVFICVCMVRICGVCVVCVSVYM